MATIGGTLYGRACLKFQEMKPVPPSVHTPSHGNSEKTWAGGADQMLLFEPASRFQCDWQVCMNLTGQYMDYLFDLSNMVGNGWAAWQKQTGFTGVSVTGPMVTGGHLTGPAMLQLLIPPASSGSLGAAVAEGFALAWATYVQTASVTSLGWYPTFACVAAKYAPATENIPSALSRLPCNCLVLVTPGLLANLMAGASPAGTLPTYARQVFLALSGAIAYTFQEWRNATYLTKVMGEGPVPMYNPPYVKFGPVVGGTATMKPGGLVALN